MYSIHCSPERASPRPAPPHGGLLPPTAGGFLQQQCAQHALLHRHADACADAKQGIFTDTIFLEYFFQ